MGVFGPIPRNDAHKNGTGGKLECGTCKTHCPSDLTPLGQVTF